LNLIVICLNTTLATLSTFLNFYSSGFPQINVVLHQFQRDAFFIKGQLAMWHMG